MNTIALGKICTVRTGKKDVNQGNPSGEYPFFTCAKDHTYSDTYSFNGKAILIAGNGVVGQTTLYEGRFEAYQRTYVLMDFDERFDWLYLHHCIKSGFQAIAESNKLGNSMPYIKKGTVENFKIPVVSIEEQRRIVAKLDAAFEKIDKAIELTQQNLENSKAMFASRLHGLLSESGKSWQKKTLKDVSKMFGRGKSKHRPRNDKTLYGGQYPFIQTGDIRNSHHFITEYRQTYNDAGLSQSKLWPKGTICITIAANIAETGILTFDACFPDSVIGLLVDSEVADRHYVEYLLQSFKTQLQALGRGSAQDNINLGTFENTYFPFPDINTQRLIVEQLDKMHKATMWLQAAYDAKLCYLDNLKQSILEQSFNGKVES